MIRVNIKTADGLSPWLDFVDQTSADAYVAEVTANEHWGPKNQCSFIFENVTAQVALERGTDDGLSAQTAGAKIIARIYAVNDLKFKTGMLSQTTYLALLADSKIQLIERLLWAGSIDTAKSLIQTLDTTFFSTDEIGGIISFIDSSG